MGSVGEEESPAHNIAEELEPPQSSVKQSFNDIVQKERHQITELRGLGKEIWGDVDAQEYVNQERDAWDG